MSSFTDRLTPDFLDAKRAIGDPPADDAVRQVIELAGVDEARRVFHTLIRRVGIPTAELPDPLPDFIREHSAAEAPVADALIETSEGVFRDHGPKILLALYHAALPRVYVCPAIARVLVATGRLAHDETSLLIFSRRIAETGQFLVDVLAPGGMRHGGPGIATTLKIRLIHAAIRHFTTAGDWDESLGTPINQEDMALTLTTFGITIVDALDRLGATLSTAEVEAYLATWNAVGHLLGIDDDLIPPAADDARTLHQRILGRQAGATAEGALLTRALVEYAGRLIEGRDLRDAPTLLIRYLAGDDIAARLDLAPPTRWWAPFLPAFLRTLFGFIERLEAASEPVARITDRLSGLMVAGMVASFNHYKGHPFQLPASLRSDWRIPLAP